MTDSRMLWDYDVRVRDRNLKTNRISREDLKRHLDGTADSANKLEPLELTQPAITSPEPQRAEGVEDPAFKGAAQAATPPFMPVAVAPAASPNVVPPFAAAPAYPEPSTRPPVAAVPTGKGSADVGSGGADDEP